MNWRYIGLILALGGALTYLSLNTGNRGEADVSRLPKEGATGQMTEVASVEANGAGVRTAPRPVGPRDEAAAAPADHTALLGELRKSFMSEPQETLDAARALEGELGVGPTAQEYRWIVARCLVNLGRFHEARAEARKLVQLSPESSWAVDAQRHLLVNPLDHPSREELMQAEVHGE